METAILILEGLGRAGLFLVALAIGVPLYLSGVLAGISAFGFLFFNPPKNKQERRAAWLCFLWAAIIFIIFHGIFGIHDCTGTGTCGRY